MKRAWLLALIFSCKNVFCAPLPTGLVTSEVQEIIEQIGEGAVTKALGNFSLADKWWPGFRVGLEFNYFQAPRLNEMGDGSTEVPTSYPSFRVVLAKKWPKNIETIFQFIPGNMLSSVGVFGIMLRANVYEDGNSRINFSPFLGYTKSSAFDGTYQGTSFEAGLSIHKEFLVFSPYAGVGLLFLSGSVSADRMRQGTNEGGHSTFHFFAGGDYRWFKNFVTTLQIDFMNLSPRASLAGFIRF